MDGQPNDLELWNKVIEGLKSLDNKDENLLIVSRRTMWKINRQRRLDRIRTLFGKFRRKNNAG